MKDHAGMVELAVAALKVGRVEADAAVCGNNLPGPKPRSTSV